MIKSIYIHIPFCKNICSYCDFCKMYYNENWVDKYLDELESEILKSYKNEIIDTLYIGGGTPSCLSIKQLNKLFNILSKIKKSKNIEFTFECNIEDITYEKMKLLFDNNVNRLSIGVQTFNKKHLSFLGRNYKNIDIIEKISLAKSVGFKNINVDLIYAISNQTIEELNEDIDTLIKLDITHISTYSLIIEPSTKLYITNTNNIDEELDYQMYKLINKKLKKNGFINYEISNYSKKGFESRHNLNYWNNNEYYGFGLGASGYVNDVRYDNTKNLNKYLTGNYIYNKHKVEQKEKIENEFILGFRKTKGINKEEFNLKYGNIKNIKQVNELLENKQLIETKNNIYINPKYMYTQNSILVKFIDS